MYEVEDDGDEEENSSDSDGKGGELQLGRRWEGVPLFWPCPDAVSLGPMCWEGPTPASFS